MKSHPNSSTLFSTQSQNKISTTTNTHPEKQNLFIPRHKKISLLDLIVLSGTLNKKQSTNKPGNTTFSNKILTISKMTSIFILKLTTKKSSKELIPPTNQKQKPTHQTYSKTYFINNKTTPYSKIPHLFNTPNLHLSLPKPMIKIYPKLQNKKPSLKKALLLKSKLLFINMKLNYLSNNT